VEDFFVVRSSCANEAVQVVCVNGLRCAMFLEDLSVVFSPRMYCLVCGSYTMFPVDRLGISMVGNFWFSMAYTSLFPRFVSLFSTSVLSLSILYSFLGFAGFLFPILLGMGVSLFLLMVGSVVCGLFRLLCLSVGWFRSIAEGELPRCKDFGEKIASQLKAGGTVFVVDCPMDRLLRSIYRLAARTG